MLPLQHLQQTWTGLTIMANFDNPAIRVTRDLRKIWASWTKICRSSDGKRLAIYRVILWHLCQAVCNLSCRNKQCGGQSALQLPRGAVCDLPHGIWGWRRCEGSAVQTSFSPGLCRSVVAHQQGQSLPFTCEGFCTSEIKPCLEGSQTDGGIAWGSFWITRFPAQNEIL